jgi:hypothetical protein
MIISSLQPSFLTTYWPPALRTILYFFTGAVFGFTLCSLSIAAIFLGREKKRKKKRELTGDCLKDEEVKALIKKKQDLLPEAAAVANNSYFRAVFELSSELMYEIAAHYFPDKKYPIYELTPQEVLDLNRYVTDRIEKIINGKIIRKFKKYRISTIVDLVNKKRDLDNIKLMKLNKQYQISKILGGVSTVWHAANPLTWLKKAAVKPLSAYVTKETAKWIIAIVGEEVDKLYSRKIFAPADDLDKADEDIVEAELEAAEDMAPETEEKPRQDAKER